MKKRTLKIPLIVILLVCLSAAVYLIQYWIFTRPEDTAFYFLEDLAFVPISVLLVTLGLNTVLNRRDRQATLEKVSIVVNEFYAEAGSSLISALRSYIINSGEISVRLRLQADWQDKEFDAVRAYLADYPLKVEIGNNDLSSLLYLLESRKDHILRLFENANLMEHDSFTDMLWAVYHVYDELRSRDSLDLQTLPAADIRHLNLDIERALRLLLLEWIGSMRAMRCRYPYLYSLEVRKCPFGNGKVNVEM